MNNLQEDRRDYFRINDQAILDIIKVDSTALNLSPQSHFSTHGGFSLLRQLRAIDSDNNQILKRLGENDRELEHYLRGLNKKIELVAATLMEHSEQAESVSPQPITLSEGGISFDSHQDLSVGDYAAIQLTLLPDRMGVCAYIEVINMGESTPRIGANFINLRESDRQILARHIMQVQINERRSREESV